MYLKLKILSIVIPLFFLCFYFTIAETKKYVDKVFSLQFKYRFSLNATYGKISSIYFCFSSITDFIAMLFTVYLKLTITSKFEIFTYDP